LARRLKKLDKDVQQFAVSSARTDEVLKIIVPNPTM